MACEQVRPSDVLPLLPRATTACEIAYKAVVSRLESADQSMSRGDYVTLEAQQNQALDDHSSVVHVVIITYAYKTTLLFEGLAKHTRCVGIDAAVPPSKKPDSRELLDQALKEKQNYISIRCIKKPSRVVILDDVALVSRLIMERPGKKVLYEIRHHASFPYDPRNPPLPQPAYQDHLLLEYGPRIIMFLVLWMVARPYFSSKLMRCLKTEDKVNQAFAEQVADGSSWLTNTLCRT
ncbi:hypothetical protein YC2023_020421 [Brassica napus]